MKNVIVQAMPFQFSVSGRSSGSFARIMALLPRCNEREADLATRTVLSALRDILPCQETLSLADQLGPYLRDALRGLIYAAGADAIGAAHEQPSLVMMVSRRLPLGFPEHACLVVRAVLEAISADIGPVGVRALMEAMPPNARKLWPRELWLPTGLAHAC